MPDVDAGLLEVLKQYWGYKMFRPLQREAMRAVVEGRDSLVVLPTGGGKSLCFQAPALVRPGLALVVSPLISLMKDQVDTLVGNGVAAACYNSAMAADERSAVAAGIREGRYRLLYVSPERLLGDTSESFLRLLPAGGVSFAAVDEAPHVHPFIDMHDLGDALITARFADPVMDMEMLTLTYPGVDALLRELHATGHRNAHHERRRGLTGRGRWARMREHYAPDAGGRVGAEFEIVYGHAWKPAPRELSDGRQIIRFDRSARAAG